MTTAVDPAVLADFQKKHPAAFWVFGEDRQQAVRKGIIPAHWFEGARGSISSFTASPSPASFMCFRRV